MKKTMLILAALTLSMGIHLGINADDAAAAQAPTQKITIDGKKPAQFDHASHAALGLSCGTCHHDAQHTPRTAGDIAAIADPAELKCSSCHNKDFPVKKLQKPMAIFHGRCKDCHKAGLDGKKGPTKCTACHVKKAAAKAIEGC